MADAQRHLTRRDALRALALTACALGVAVRGRAAAPAGGGPAVRFTVFSAKPITDLAYAPRLGAPPQKMQFYPTARSPRYEYRGLMPLRFVDATTGATVAEASVPSDLREPLLLFSPLEEAAAAASASGGKPALRYQIAVLDDSLARHASGGLSILNLSGLALAGTVNKKALTLAVGLNPTLDIGRVPTAITLRTTFNKRTYQAYAGNIRLAARQRALLILFPPFNKGSVEVQSRLLLDETPAPVR